MQVSEKSYIHRVIKEMRDIEERGRNIAYVKRNEPAYDEVREWCNDVRRTAILAFELLPYRYKDLEKFVDKIYRIGIAIENDAYRCKYPRLKNVFEGASKEPISKCSAKEAAAKCHWLDEAYDEISGGERCTYLCDEVKDYKLTAAVNDLTSCYHRLIEMVEEKIRDFNVEGKCYYTRDADKDLVEACKLWDKATDKFNANLLYSDDDADSLKCVIIGRKAEFTVGSSPGHRTHIDLDKGTLEYYDEDTDVNMVMRDILSTHGVDCKADLESVGCSGINEENVKPVAVRLAAATSMDYRMEDPKEWWKYASKTIPEIKECGFNRYDEGCRVRVKLKEGGLE